MSLSRPRGLLFAALLCLCGPVAAEEAIPATPMADLGCGFHHRVSEVDRFSLLPASLKRFLLAKFPAGEMVSGGMAERGAFFNKFDALQRYAPTARFIRAGHVRQVWFIWYESGGRPYLKNIAVFSLPKSAGAPRLIADMGYENQNPCLLTDSVLDGGRPSEVRKEPQW
jgi:hypothetical protein